MIKELKEKKVGPETKVRWTQQMTTGEEGG